jgi:hypothetical protein
VVNNADDPPFATLIEVDTNNGHLALGTKITFSTATNGAEQPVWDRGTGKFYQSIPQVGGDVADGAFARINPHTGAVEKMFPVKYCQPAGLTGSSHSVAVNPHNNQAFVPLPANNVFPNRLNGCIGYSGCRMATMTRIMAERS